MSDIAMSVTLDQYKWHFEDWEIILQNGGWGEVKMVLTDDELRSLHEQIHEVLGGHSDDMEQD